jgi:alpha-amylase/alpha-mannosidase (GH57 family)
MATEPTLSLLFLWHQHQPLYKDSVTNRYELPWVRLHATKDYYDMVALLDEFPTLKANVNLVPSLLTQLDDYAQGKAQDIFLELTLKPAKDLAPEDRAFILQNFFMANWEHMVDAHPRYRELLDQRGRVSSPETLLRAQKLFKDPDWRDLQTWFNLSWFDPLWKEKDPFIKGLFEKGKNFTEEDKQTLVDKQRKICGQIVAKHKELQDRGQIEVTTTPFYHPILPLLIDTEAARMALPHVRLPRQRFQHIEDAREQIRRAIEDYKQRFGRPPQGMWPSEGSVSEDTARLFLEMGIRWIATDEAVLARSVASGFNHDDLYEPYKLTLGEKSLNFFFRDHELSDAIGFVYSSWNPEDAANDFMRRLHDIQKRFRLREGDKPRPHVVSVILDGENCWEYYKDDGLPFLRALYKRLAADSTIETVRAGDYLSRVKEIQTLPKLWSGSWINHNFAIWIGHEEDNQAWDMLSRTRQFLLSTLGLHPELKTSQKATQAWEEIYIAEGSDWCWWYGDDHASSNDDMFDYLFRKHLMNVYQILGEKIPEDLHLPIKRKHAKAPVTEPSDFITPILDGRVTNYFEWQSAGVYHTEAGATGTMHKSENLIKTIYFGFDLNNLYFRLDLNKPLTTDDLSGISLKLVFTEPTNHELTVEFAKENKLALTLKTPVQTITLPAGAYQKIVEFTVPVNRIENPNKTAFELAVVVMRDSLEQERWPSGLPLQISYPDTNVFIENWHL